jgi:uncharacterized YccA/Bax inhibitor family protein
MAIYKSGNLALKETAFTGFDRVEDDANVMTLQGTVNKTMLLLLLVIMPALYVWNLFDTTQDISEILPWLLGGAIGGLITAMIIAFNRQLSAYLAPVYAVLEGLVLGGLSALMELRYPGIVIEALMLTFGIFAVLLVIYKLEIIKATENFKLIVVSATGGIAVFYLISFVLSFFSIRVPLINDNSMMGIVFSLIVVVVAALNLVVDFDFIEQGVARRVPKYMEWYGAFGLMVTLIWLYVEILRLLGKSRSR